jgi:hypothetical protein
MPCVCTLVRDLLVTSKATKQDKDDESRWEARIGIVCENETKSAPHFKRLLSSVNADTMLLDLPGYQPSVWPLWQPAPHFTLPATTVPRLIPECFQQP